MIGLIGTLVGTAWLLLVSLGALAGGALMGGVGGALVALVVALVIGVWFGPLSLLAVITSILAGVVIGHGMSETRREREYRAARRRQKDRQVDDPTALTGLVFARNDWSR